MIIDAHAHVYLNPRIKFTPDGTTMMSAEDQLSVMDKLGIEKTVIRRYLFARTRSLISNGKNIKPNSGRSESPFAS